MEFLKKHNIVILCFLLIVSLSSLAAYGYLSQKKILLQQLKMDTEGIAASVASSISKFGDIKETMNIQGLIKNISLKLDIFEFRYLDKDGTILNSMFTEEIGKKFKRPGFDLSDKKSLGKFYEDNRDLTNVLAISFPVRQKGEIIGIIDLAVDISEFDSANKKIKDSAIKRMKTDVSNLLNAIASSVLTSLDIFQTVDFFDFLNNFVKSKENIIEVAVITPAGKVQVSSNKENIGRERGAELSKLQSGFVVEGGRDAYRIISPINPHDKKGNSLMLLIDATNYVANVRQMFFIAVATSLFTIVFSLTIAYSIYRINLERAKRENAILEMKVRERTKEIGDIMDNVGQGILTFSKELIVNPEYSLVSEKIFGRKPAGISVAELLYETEKERKSYIEWACMIFGDNRLMSTEDILNIAEKEVVLNTNGSKKTIRVEYCPIYEEGSKNLKKVMAVLTDITGQKELEAASAREKAEHERVVKILRDQDTFFSFLSDARGIIHESEEIVARLMDAETDRLDIVNKLFRGMHTIKGTAAVFAITDVSSLAHSIENVFNEIRQKEKEVTPVIVEELRKQIGELFKLLEGVVHTMVELVGETFGTGHKVVKIRHEKFSAFREIVNGLQINDEVLFKIKNGIDDLLKIPIGRAFMRFTDMAKVTAEKLGKDVRLSIIGGDIEIDREMGDALYAPMVHLIRNAIDHGIEDPADRAMLGKTEAGHVIIECSMDNGNIIVMVKDDGKGIDPIEIRGVAVRKGLLSEEQTAKLSDNEAVHLIFHPGFSSKEEATDLSGRGVGMDVVKTEVEKYKGSVEIETEVLKGTIFKLRVPAKIVN